MSTIDDKLNYLVENGGGGGSTPNRIEIYYTLYYHWGNDAAAYTTGQFIYTKNSDGNWVTSKSQDQTSRGINKGTQYDSWAHIVINKIVVSTV